MCRNCETVSAAGQGYCGDGIVQAAHEACDGSVCCNSTCTVETPGCDAGCLIISEYVEGVQEDKAVELYNCDTQTISLNGVSLCMIDNEKSDCGNYHDLSGSLAPGETLSICNNQSTFPSAYCDIYEGYVTRFNGDDRLVLFQDLNADHKIDPTDVIFDAFGETAFWPTNYDIWASKRYSRCDFTPYKGLTTWNVESYFIDTGAVSYQGLGTPPTQGCF